MNFASDASPGPDLAEGDGKPPYRKNRKSEHTDRRDKRGCAPGLRCLEQAAVPVEYGAGINRTHGAARFHRLTSLPDSRCRIRSVTRSMIATETMIISRMALTSV